MSSNFLTYKGYSAAIEFDAIDQVFFGRVIGIRSMMDFHGDTVSDLKNSFHVAIDSYLADCKENGETPEKPETGNITFNIPLETYAAVTRVAHSQDKSVNQWAKDLIISAA